jgi:paraquat-inducible protein A
MSHSAESLIACHICDVVHEQLPLPNGGKAHCSRCGHHLYGGGGTRLDLALAQALAALVFFVPAMTMPIMSLNVLSKIKSCTVSSAVYHLYAFDLWMVAAFCLFTLIIVPFVNISALAYVLGGIRMRRRLPLMAEIFRLYQALREWGMLEVFLLGIFVSLIKLRDLASIQWGLGYFCFLAVLILSLGAYLSLDRHAVWDELEDLR